VSAETQVPAPVWSPAPVLTSEELKERQRRCVLLGASELAKLFGAAARLAAQDEADGRGGE